MSEKPLFERLQAKAGYKLLVLNSPAGYFDLLGDLPNGTTLAASSNGQYDLVQVFVYNVDNLAALAPAALASIKKGGVLWFCFPKKSSRLNTDIDRDHGWEVVRQAGYEVVRVISIDDVWSASRFRLSEEIKVRQKK